MTPYDIGLILVVAVLGIAILLGVAWLLIVSEDLIDFLYPFAIAVLLVIGIVAFALWVWGQI